jgi:predicted phage terminase large subunit-like protein
MDDEGRLFLVHVLKERMDSLEIVNTMMALQHTYQPVLFGVEKGVIQKSIGPYLNTEMLKRNEYINLMLMAPSMDKTSRAGSIQARMRAGAVRFDKEADWFQPFEEELLRFPRDKHDDQVDAWAYMGLLLDRMYEAPTEKESEDEEYRLMRRKHETNEYTGRSVTTGY